MDSKRIINSRVKKMHALRNPGRPDTRDFAELASDIVNACGLPRKNIAIKCNLSLGTVIRVSECRRPYRPNALTIEKILIAFGYTVEIT